VGVTQARLCGVAILALVVGSTGLCQTEELRTPRLSSNETLPPRVLLEDGVSVSVTGTVVHAVRALLEPTDRDFAIGSPTKDFGAVALFEAKDVPLWQALDSMLDVYGYDWGIRGGVIALWPVFEPRRERPVPPQSAEPREGVAPAQAPPLQLLEPTLVGEALESAREAKIADVMYDEEAGSWYAVVRLRHADQLWVARTFACATGATTGGVYPYAVLRVGSFRRLDAAMRATSEAALGPAATEATAEAIRRGVVALLTAQQADTVRRFGTAQLAFRELPTPLAALFVQYAEAKVAAMRTPGGTPMGIDWTQPGAARVEVRTTRGTFVNGKGARSTSVYLVVSCVVPNTDGGECSF